MDGRGPSILATLCCCSEAINRDPDWLEMEEQRQMGTVVTGSNFIHYMTMLGTFDFIRVLWHTWKTGHAATETLKQYFPYILAGSQRSALVTKTLQTRKPRYIQSLSFMQTRKRSKVQGLTATKGQAGMRQKDRQECGRVTKLNLSTFH